MQDNGVLTDVSAPSLEIVESSLRISGNPSLVHLEMPSLERAADYSAWPYEWTSLVISQNDSLPNLDGLCALKTVQGVMTIEDNQSLADIDGLISLETIGTSLEIAGNDALASIEGLSNLRTVWSGPSVISNASLASLEGLGSLQDAYLDVAGNETLETIGDLSNLETGALFIWGNESLYDLGDISGAETLDYLYINNNESLSSLNGLSSLTDIEHDLEISYNYCLEEEHVNQFASAIEVGGDALWIGNGYDYPCD